MLKISIESHEKNSGEKGCLKDRASTHKQRDMMPSNQVNILPTPSANILINGEDYYPFFNISDIFAPKLLAQFRLNERSMVAI